VNVSIPSRIGAGRNRSPPLTFLFSVRLTVADSSPRALVCLLLRSHRLISPSSATNLVFRRPELWVARNSFLCPNGCLTLWRNRFQRSRNACVTGLSVVRFRSRENSDRPSFDSAFFFVRRSTPFASFRPGSSKAQVFVAYYFTSVR
jgi:hypothetical protein